MRKKIRTFFSLVIFSSCSMLYNSDKFDRNVWLSNSDVTDTWNPRSKMTRDLMENYLKPGMSRDSILSLLGKPYLERIENRLPKGLDVPDSLSLGNDSVGLVALFDSVDLQKKMESKIKAVKELDEFNTWYRTNSQPDTLMLYPVGWSTIDPNFLVIKFKADSTVCEFWIEQG